MRRFFATRPAWCTYLLLLLLTMQLVVPVRAAVPAFLVKDINPGLTANCGYNSSCISSPIAMNNELFFAADNGHSTGQLWKSDGSTNGTTLVKETNPLSVSPLPFTLTNVAGTL